jgi:hypothetical protein
VLLVLGAIIGIRVWWLNRNIRKQFGRQARGHERSSGERIDVIEGEYDVVSRDERRRRH